MTDNKKNEITQHNHHDFSRQIPLFDEAMRKIASVPKQEVSRREQEEAARKQANR